MKRTARSFDRLHHAPDQADMALVLIDVINDREFDGADELLTHAIPMAHALAALRRRAKARGIPGIYANDNFGRWRSDFLRLVQRCLQSGVRGRPIVAQLQPEEDDYFVLKPKHSAFFSDQLRNSPGLSGLILTGIAGDICVLFSANDAYMRDFRIFVAADCTACETDERSREALILMQRVLKANISPSLDLELEKLASQLGRSER